MSSMDHFSFLVTALDLYGRVLYESHVTIRGVEIHKAPGAAIEFAVEAMKTFTRDAPQQCVARWTLRQLWIWDHGAPGDSSSSG